MANVFLKVEAGWVLVAEVSLCTSRFVFSAGCFSGPYLGWRRAVKTHGVDRAIVRVLLNLLSEMIICFRALPPKLLLPSLSVLS